MIANPEHEITYQELTALIAKHTVSGKLSSLEVLAIAANMVGKILAMQDQRKITPAKAMEVVAKNLELGNAQVIEEIRTATGGHG